MESWPCYARTLKDRYCKKGEKLQVYLCSLGVLIKKKTKKKPHSHRSMFHRYSDETIEAVEMLDSDDKIDLELIASLIRQIVLYEGVS